MSNDDLYKVALEAVQSVYDDNSVETETTLEHLRSLHFEIEAMIEALE